MYNQIPIKLSWKLWKRKTNLNPIQDVLFRGCSQMRGRGGGGKRVTLPEICHTHPTMMKLGTVIPYQKKIQKIYESRDTPLDFCWYQHLEWSRFKFNNLALALGTNLKFSTSLSKGLKLKVRKFCGLIPTFAEVTGEKLVGVALSPPILNRFKQNSQSNYKQKIHGVFCRKNFYFRNASFKGASPRTTLKSVKDICDKICRNKTQIKVPLKLFAIICFWLYYFGSIKSANLQIFKISTKTIKFLFRWSYMKKDHLNSKSLIHRK